jgi:hypothetical protein
MLIKLFKYDFLSTNKSLIAIYLLTLISTFIVLISSSFNGDIAIATEAIAKDFALVCIVIAIIVPFFRCFFKIKNSLYKNEGYLTNTLPVKRGTLFDAKILSALITLEISWIIVISCFMSSFSGMNIVKLFVNVMNDADMLNTSLEVLSILLSQLIFIFMCFVLGLVIGYSFDDKKDLITFITSILIYLISHIFIIYIIKSCNLDYSIYMSQFLLIISVIIYFISRNKFKKGVNLE